MKRGAITPPPSRPDLLAVMITAAAALRGRLSFTLKDVRGITGEWDSKRLTKQKVKENRRAKGLRRQEEEKGNEK